MTNLERFRRHLSNSSTCSVCNGGVETIMHVLRDCPAMAGVWERIVPWERRNGFFEASLLEWLSMNLREDVSVDGSSWASLFAVSIWWSWK